MPQAPAKGALKEGAVAHFFATRNIQNSVTFVEAGMVMEGQIMCVEQCTL